MCAKCTLFSRTRSVSSKASGEPVYVGVEECRWEQNLTREGSKRAPIESGMLLVLKILRQARRHGNTCIHAFMSHIYIYLCTIVDAYVNKHGSRDMHARLCF